MSTLLTFNINLIFILTKDTRILLFLAENYVIKMDVEAHFA